MFSRAVLIARELFHARHDCRVRELSDTSRLLASVSCMTSGFVFLRNEKKFTSIVFVQSNVINRSLIKAIDSVGDPPLPIPNREVKPNSADGTAKICGRVGHRHFYKENFKKLRFSFLLYMQVSHVIHKVFCFICVV